MIDASILCDVGISYPLVTEIGRQMTEGKGHAHLLCALGVNAGPAIELSRQITAGSYSDNLLCYAMWNPTQAVAIANFGLTSAAPSFADGQTAPTGFHWDFVTDDNGGSRITDDVTGQPIVDLVAN